MENIKDKIKSFLRGWESHAIKERPKTFWKYFIYYPLNWIWTFGSILFIWLLVKDSIRYEAPVFLILAFIPFTLLVYNFVDEYYAFKYYTTGYRRVEAKKLSLIAFSICLSTFIMVVVKILFS